VYVFACSACKIKLYRLTPAPRCCPGCAAPLKEQALPRTARAPLSRSLGAKPAEGAPPPAAA
jgi:hypothetical protein